MIGVVVDLYPVDVAAVFAFAVDEDDIVLNVLVKHTFLDVER